MECVVCLEISPKVRLNPCNHEMCEECITTYMKKFATCPMCRETIHACDPVFKTSKKTRDVVLTKDAHQKLGLTIVNDTNGVLITHVEFGSVAMTYGLKKNDKILTLNGLPCLSKDVLSKICDALTVVVFTVEDKPWYSFLNIG